VAQEISFVADNGGVLVSTGLLTRKGKHAEVRHLVKKAVLYKCRTSIRTGCLIDSHVSLPLACEG
jgi:hypothetical protein